MTRGDGSPVARIEGEIAGARAVIPKIGLNRSYY